ncbi:unnamed protein product [Rhizoctonia solani]|uniref:Uncharacterized protein n=1 Tax=Rhizoctonia solani TaxID=456999 RepID=A0A8H3HCN3_9AGAM|nr:unnamed protein product [Rhizoctonia solani]
MSYQRYNVDHDTGRPCKTCRNKGRTCNKCWSFSIGRASSAVPANPEAGLLIWSSNLGSVKPREARSYRRILPKVLTSSFQSNTPCGSSQTRPGSPLAERQLFRSPTPMGQEDGRDQNTMFYSSSGASKATRIHILIPPMDELGKAVQFIVTQRRKSSSASYPSDLSCFQTTDLCLNSRSSNLLFSDDRFVSQLALFKPRNAKFSLDAKRTATQLQTSQVMHWLLFLMCIIYRELLDGNERIYKRHHISWVNRFEQHIASRITAITGPVTPADSRSQLTSHIEVSLLKHEVTETIAEGYACLQSSSLSFLQLAFSEPALWSSENASMSIPLTRALSSTRGEINRFACTDVMTALALGLPTLAVYDTSLDELDIPSFHAMEYVHGCPTEFLITLMEIHNWRLEHPDDMCARQQWQAIEERIMRLRQADETDAANSAQAVIRLAVRESWRHATLIYLYLAMCGARSDDPRIQSSVRQVIKLIDNVRPDTSYTTFFFLQYLFVSLFIQAGVDRAHHLWHGAAANGRGVTWKDYLGSRSAVIPINL